VQDWNLISFWETCSLWLVFEVTDVCLILCQAGWATVKLFGWDAVSIIMYINVNNNVLLLDWSAVREIFSSFKGGRPSKRHSDRVNWAETWIHEHQNSLLAVAGGGGVWWIYRRNMHLCGEIAVELFFLLQGLHLHTKFQGNLPQAKVRRVG